MAGHTPGHAHFGNQPILLLFCELLSTFGFAALLARR